MKLHGDLRLFLRMGPCSAWMPGHPLAIKQDTHPITNTQQEAYRNEVEMISKYPPNGTHPTPLLFIHGSLHGAWCWDVHFLDYFAEHGFAAHAVNLRGHGNSEGREALRWMRIADFVDDVANAAAQLPSPPILIGHSWVHLLSKSGGACFSRSRAIVIAAAYRVSASSNPGRTAAPTGLLQGQLEAEPFPTRRNPQSGARSFLFGRFAK
jgi:hypothetical protein